MIEITGAIGALCLFTASSDDAGQSLMQNVLERAPQAEWSEAGPKVEGEAVSCPNPFDAHETLEFPAGTSEAEARDAVAQMLMERAMDRQRQFDARVSLR